jgi:hypothetical protein
VKALAKVFVAASAPARAAALTSVLAAAVAACGGASSDARYPSRPGGCPVKSYPAAPPVAVDELGPVAADCVAAGSVCERSLLDAVCAKGGDVAWGLGDNSLSAVHVTAHAAHTKRATKGPGERGCAVQVFEDAPPMPTENIGPVAAACSPDDSREVCLRELEDQVCLMGGDVVWQVDGPKLDPTTDKQRMRGRAAHTK